MSKRARMERLKNLMRDMPESEVEALLRRVKLKGIDKSNVVSQDILSKLSNSLDVENNAIGTLQPFPEHAIPGRVKNHSKGRVKNNPSSSPINNWPDYDPADGGLPDAVTLEIFALRRRTTELTAKLADANNKLSDALECLFSQQRFLELWVNDGQGESYDKLQARIKRIQATINHSQNRNTGPSPDLTLPERWKSK